MKTIILAIADTHVGDASSTLPQILLNLLATRKPDIIVHAGDITNASIVLPQLCQVAQTIAVKGDNDHLDLPTRQWIGTNHRKILLLHGDRPHLREKPSIRVNKFLALFSSKLRWWNGYIKDLCQPLINNMPDIIVCGHLHFAFKKRVDQTLIINPGAVFMSGQGIQKNIPPSVAYITIESDAVHTEFVRLVPDNDLLLNKTRLVPRRLSGVRETE